MSLKEFTIKPVHPFPARMAPSIVWDQLSDSCKKLKILDPMAGSGTTLATARMRGHQAIGFDTDPMAVLISKAWCSDLPKDFLVQAQVILQKAIKTSEAIFLRDAYPEGADDETKAFVRFWYDSKSRKQLTALACVISLIKDRRIKDLMWCVFSRMIITKKIGVSLGMDISHSRPHRAYKIAPVMPFAQFLKAAKTLYKASPFKIQDNKKLPQIAIKKGDARKLPLKDRSVDMVITSPPYLNAIDYMRGHKLSLIWMGYSISQLRGIRSTNIGAENCKRNNDQTLSEAFMAIGGSEDASERFKGMLYQYLSDMRSVLCELKRVLVEKGKVVMVIGDCNIKGRFISNSKAIQHLAVKTGFVFDSIAERPLPENRRYLPPPAAKSSGRQLQSRMRKEIILVLSNG